MKRREVKIDIGMILLVIATIILATSESHAWTMAGLIMALLGFNLAGGD